MEIDRFDRQILQVLQKNGRISNQDLADLIGLSPSPCLRRVRALEEAGATVVGVAVIVERGAAPAVESAGYEYRTVFTLADLGL